MTGSIPRLKITTHTNHTILNLPHVFIFKALSSVSPRIRINFLVRLDLREQSPSFADMQPRSKIWVQTSDRNVPSGIKPQGSVRAPNKSAWDRITYKGMYLLRSRDREISWDQGCTDKNNMISMGIVGTRCAVSQHCEVSSGQKAHS